MLTVDLAVKIVLSKHSKIEVCLAEYFEAKLSLFPE